MTRPALGPLAAVLLIGLVLYVQAVIGGVLSVAAGFVWALLELSGSSDMPSDIEAWFSAHAIFFALPAAVLSAPVGWLVLRRVLPGGLADIGWRRPSGLHLAAAASAGLLAGATYLVVFLVTRPAVEADSLGTMATAAASGGLHRHVWAILALLVAPLLEEFLFRGVLFTALRDRWGVAVAAVGSGLLFLVSHIAEATIWQAWVGLGAATLALTLIRIRSDSVAASWVTHAAYNAVIVALVYSAG